jgi:flagellar assembly factor FliW
VIVATKAYGSIEVNEQQRVSFPLGLFGFETFNEYVLLEAEREPYYWLQSGDMEHIAFILINPFLFRPDYEINIENEGLNAIGITDPSKALIFTIVTIPRNGGPLTANLQGPVIINRENGQGMQAVLTDSRWKTKHDILAEISAAKGQ